MAGSKKQKDKPTHARYVATDRKTQNKIRRITKYNGLTFLAKWKAAKGIR